MTDNIYRLDDYRKSNKAKSTKTEKEQMENWLYNQTKWALKNSYLFGSQLKRMDKTPEIEHSMNKDY